MHRDGGGVVIEILIICFQEAVDDAIGFRIRSHIRTEEDAVGILQEEAPGCIRLAAQFTDAGGDIHEEVRAAVEQGSDPGQVLGVTAHVGADEGCVRVTCYKVGQPIHDVQEGREGRAGEGPIGMCAQFLPALVGFIDRVEEGHRVRHVDHNRQAQFTGGFPDGGEARVIHIHQLAGVVFDVQAESLPDLQPLCAALFLNPEPARRPFGKSISLFRPLAPVHAAEDHETFRGGLFKVIEMGVEQVLTPAAVEIDITDNASSIQKVK